MLFSLLHPTSRVPSGWFPAYAEWYNHIANASNMDYVLSVHESDFESAHTVWTKVGRIGRLVTYTGRRCSVDGWNAAAAASTGDVLILVADDFFPPQNWDILLEEVIGNRTDEFAVHVGTGSPRDKELMSHVIISRALYKRLGYVQYPEYESMYADDDITQLCYSQNLVIPALHLKFEHRHPHFGKRAMDSTYERQNRSEAYRLGEAILKRRKQDNFLK